MRHGEAELVDGDGEVGHHEEHGAQAGRQLGPGPQVVGQLQARHRPPAHEADEADVDGHQVGEGPGQVGVEQQVAERGHGRDDQAGAHVKGFHAKGRGVEDVGDGKHQEACGRGRETRKLINMPRKGIRWLTFVQAPPLNGHSEIPLVQLLLFTLGRNEYADMFAN